MGQLFGKSSKAPPKTEKRTVSDKDKAVLKLKRARDKLTKFQKKTDIDAQKLQNRAKELIQKGNKDHALITLKIRKLKLKEVASVDSKLMNVVQMIEEIEWESQNVEVLQALEAGTAALDKLHQEMPIEEVERILEESTESMELQSQISDMISGGQFTEADENELEAQLAALGEDEDEVDEKEETETTDSVRLPEVPTTPVFPTAPTHEPVIKESKETVEEEDNRVAA